MHLLFDTSIYVRVLRDSEYAAQFRKRYLQDIPRTHFSSVVIEELLAGARSLRHRREAAALYEPFEKVERIVTPGHSTWKDAGAILSHLLVADRGIRDRLQRGFLNDILIALSARQLGATLVTSNAGDFELIRQQRRFSLEVV